MSTIVGEGSSECPTCHEVAFNGPLGGCDNPRCERWHGDPYPWCTRVARVEWDRLAKSREIGGFKPLYWDDLHTITKVDLILDVLRKEGF